MANGRQVDPPILAVDVDGTMVDADNRFLPGVKEAMLELRKRGWRILIFTVRDDEEATAELLRSEGIPFDAINQNLPGKGSDSPKIYYDVLIDDRALNFDGSWSNMVSEVERLRRRNEFGEDQRILVKRLNSNTLRQEVVAEFGLDNAGRFGMIRKSGTCAELLDDILEDAEGCSAEELRQRLLALNGSRLWTEVHTRKSRVS